MKKFGAGSERNGRFDPAATLYIAISNSIEHNSLRVDVEIGMLCCSFRHEAVGSARIQKNTHGNVLDLAIEDVKALLTSCCDGQYNTLLSKIDTLSFTSRAQGCARQTA
jgi:hypothetical protein